MARVGCRKGALTLSRELWSLERSHDMRGVRKAWAGPSLRPGERAIVGVARVSVGPPDIRDKPECCSLTCTPHRLLSDITNQEIQQERTVGADWILQATQMSDHDQA